MFDEHTREIDYSDKSVTGKITSFEAFEDVCTDMLRKTIVRNCDPNYPIMYNSLCSKLTWIVWILPVFVSENTRAAYPIEYIPNAKLPCVGPHPKNVILLACDAFGVLPPVSKLSLAQTMYHFISGYTALVL